MLASLESPVDLALLLLLALLLFGSKRLPEIGRSLGSGLRQFKDSVSGVDEIRDIVNDVTEVRQALSPTNAVRNAVLGPTESDATAPPAGAPGATPDE